MRARNPMCLALLALLGLYVGNMLLIIRAETQRPFQARTLLFIKLNSPLAHKKRRKKGPIYYNLSAGRCPTGFLPLMRGKASNLLQ